MLVHTLLICLHVLAAAFWVGGMAVLHFAARPAALQTLVHPPVRLAFMAALLSRFLAGAGIAVLVLLASGLSLVVRGGGFGALHASVHAMVAIGLLMAAVFARVRFGLYPRLAREVEASRWAEAGAVLAKIRAAVVLNLALGTAVFVIALMGRAL